MNVKFILEIVFLYSAVSYVASNDCESITDSLRLCANKQFDPNDLIGEPTYRPMEISFVSMIGVVTLTIPEKLRKRGIDYATYRKFHIADSCVNDIEVDFFRNLDRDKASLEDIEFKKITCLKKLSLDNFRGIETFVKILTFDTMTDLVEIDSDFFDSFHQLEKLTIVNTRIQKLPEQMLRRLDKLQMLNVNSNQLTGFPWIPEQKGDFVEKINAENNPFDCQCSLQLFVMAMKKALSSNMYKCASPLKFKGHPLNHVQLCETTSVTLKSKKSEQPLATANVRIEIIIAVSLLILVICIIVIVVVLVKRHGKQKKSMAIYEQRSPSKLICQNDGEFAQPFILTYKS